MSALRISFIGPASGFSVLLLVFLTVFRIVPDVSHITLRIGRGVKGRRQQLRTFAIVFCELKKMSDILQQTSRLTTLYFPYIDSVVTLRELVRSFITKKQTWFRILNIFYTFFELDFVFNYAFNTLKIFTAGWIIDFFANNTCMSRQQRVDLLRCLYFPV